MTTKEKAIELMSKFRKECWGMEPYWGKKCALICVDEIIIQLNEGSSLWVFWVDVKHEIENYEI